MVTLLMFIMILMLVQIFHHAHYAANCYFDFFKGIVTVIVFAIAIGIVIVMNEIIAIVIVINDQGSDPAVFPVQQPPNHHNKNTRWKVGGLSVSPTIA